MTDDRTLERAARSWLEEGPVRAPQQPVDAALTRIQRISQERGLIVPRRIEIMPMPARLAAAAIALAVVVVGVLVLRPRDTPNVGATAAPTAQASPSPTAVAVAPSSSPQPDWSSLPGRLLVEHLGNALDLTESTATDNNPGTRRFYFMEPSDMTAATVSEFLKGQPETGKSAADISSDGMKVVFQDYTAKARLYEANLDGTAFHKLPVDCGSCQLLYPDYDPTATKVVYVRIEGAESWLEVVDLGSGKTTRLDATRGSSENEVPEQPAWSPDGKTIAYTTINWPAPNEPDLGTVHFGDVAPLSGRIGLYDVANGTVRDILHASTLSPGDVNWSPDSQTILFTAGPLSTTAGVAAAGLVHQNYAIDAEGTGLRAIPGNGSPEYFAGGQYVLVKVYCDGDFATFGDCGGRDSFGVMRGDFTDARQLRIGAMDVTGGPQGFAQIAHWVAAP